jgi:aminoglycoside 6'-N-acetyltransferase I
MSMIENMMIRKIELSDLPQIMEAFIRTYSKEPWNEDWDNVILKERITDFILVNTGINFCAVDAQANIVGVMFGRRNYWIKSKEYFVDEFFVDYAFQNKGVGQFMVEEISQILKADGYEDIILNTEKGFPCEKFYLKNGFQIKQSNIFMFKVI